MHGLLNINKPAGMTSFGVVDRVKHLSGERRVGHAGTLDPLATGVLPVCLGQATRVIEFLFDSTKTYRAQIELGITTDTYDSSGKVISIKDASGISREMVGSTLDRFRGPILQTPPMYSAIKHHGQPLYKLARSGIEVERKSRPAQIYSLEITDWQPPVVSLDITCGKGTYIRCLAHDLGEALGCGASMKSLLRLKVGPFNVEDALTLSQLEEAFKSGKQEECLYPIDYVLMPYPRLVVDREQEFSLIHGAPITLDSLDTSGPPPISESRSRAYDSDGKFLGMVKYDIETACWRPEKIFCVV